MINMYSFFKLLMKANLICVSLSFNLQGDFFHSFLSLSKNLAEKTTFVQKEVFFGQTLKVAKKTNLKERYA